jgi:hypothetical protein
MFPFGFALGALTGAAAVLVLGQQVLQRGRPVAKAALKAALAALHEAQFARHRGISWIFPLGRRPTAKI